MRPVFIIILTLLGSNPAFAASPSSLGQILEANEFKAYRDLIQFVNLWGAEFAKKLASLDGNSHIVDMGSGLGFFERGLYSRLRNPELIKDPESRELIMELLSRPAKDRPRITGITKVMGTTPPDREAYLRNRIVDINSEGRIRYMLDWIFGEPDFPYHALGEVDLYIDLYGILPYSTKPDWILALELAHLARNGEIWTSQINSNPVVYPNGTHPLSYWLTTIRGVDLAQLKEKTGANAPELTWPAIYQSFRMKRRQGEPAHIPRIHWDLDKAEYRKHGTPHGEYQAESEMIIVKAR